MLKSSTAEWSLYLYLRMKKITLILFLVFNVYSLRAQLDSIIDQGVFRTYIVHLPSGYNTNNKYPLVFNLHGLRANALQQKTITKFEIGRASCRERV